VVVPAYQAADVLPQSLSALARSDLPRQHWELIVVDDASADQTTHVAEQWADRVVTVSPGPRGPAFARNRGAEVASGEWLVFIDADVAVHANTLSTIAAIVQERSGFDAVFGAYDASPPAPNFLSQYRNLLHRYVHLRGAGEAETFWAGCGAVRRTAFEGVGGFDERRFPRPQIEDIDLGYRLRERGGRILLDPAVQGTHLKRWTLRSITRTDFFDRGVPWVRLLLARGHLHRSTALNLKQGERVKTGLVGVALGLMAIAVAGRRWEPAAAAFAIGAGVVIANRHLFSWFAHQRGLRFALAVVPMHLWYYVLSGLAVTVGTALHAFGGAVPASSGDNLSRGEITR
jgi:glycosyltransferase involved in cell wall biosynthesis